MYPIKTCHEEYDGEEGGEIEIMSLFEGELPEETDEFKAEDTAEPEKTESAAPINNMLIQTPQQPMM